MKFLRAASLLVAAVAGLAAVYTRLSAQSVINSDGANEALQGLAFWNGNVLLRGWWLAQDTFYFTDAPLYGLIARLQGLGPWVVHEGAGLVYALAVVVAALLARGTLRGRDGWVAAGLTAAVLSLPPALLLQGQMHILGVTYVLAGLLLLERRPAPAWVLVVAWLLMAAAMASDPLVTVVFAPAIAAVAAARRRWRLVAAVVAAALTTVGVPHLTAVLGGFERPRALHVALAAPSQLWTNLELAVRGVLLVLGGDVVDAPRGDLVAWLHLLGVAAVLAGLALAATRLRSRAEEDFIPQVLLLASMFDVGAFVFSSQPFDLASSRFLSPLALTGAVLAGRMLAPLLVHSRARPLAAGAAAALVLTVPLQLTRPAAPAPTATLERWLLSRGLDHGVGAYWESSIVTLDTRGVVTVRCVDSSGGPSSRAVPDRWFQDSAWFRGQRVVFVVFSPGERPANIDERRALAVFGPPAEIDRVGRYEVLVYARDLLPAIAR